MIALRRILVLALPLVLAALGYPAGSALSHFNDKVRLAEIVVAAVPVPAREKQEAEQAFARYQDELRERPDLATKAEGPLTSDQAVEILRTEALGIQRTFRIGGLLLGFWCGLVAAVRVAALGRVPRRKDYEIEQGLCVSCGRCFAYCPMERTRLKDRGRPLAEAKRD